MFFTLGAGSEGARAKYISREVRYGILAMDAFALEAA
jgi:4,5-DOPA dioxygenase extradiol